MTRISRSLTRPRAALSRPTRSPTRLRSSVTRSRCSPSRPPGPRSVPVRPRTVHQQLSDRTVACLAMYRAETTSRTSRFSRRYTRFSPPHYRTAHSHQEIADLHQATANRHQRNVDCHHGYAYRPHACVPSVPSRSDCFSTSFSHCHREFFQAHPEIALLFTPELRRPPTIPWVAPTRRLICPPGALTRPVELRARHSGSRYLPRHESRRHRPISDSHLTPARLPS
jgi:hypothetical protein